MRQSKRDLLAGLVLIAIVVVVAMVVFRSDQLRSYVSKPEGIMGTQCSLHAVVPAGRAKRAESALQQAEQQLRDIEAGMSIHLEGTETSQFNAAPGGEIFPATPQFLDIMELSRELAEQTCGAFDVTCLPILQFWRQSAQRDVLPTSEQLKAAREASRWEDIIFVEEGILKTKESASVDLGGIAKGYGIDQAVEAMMRFGLEGGLVDAGGDIRCFGVNSAGRPWRIGVRNPFEPQAPRPILTLAISEGAVCTSGNYFRFSQVAGKKINHIIDPRPDAGAGQPADSFPSVTVFAPTASLADGWATALSVLGPAGFKLLPDDGAIQAMIVLGGPDAYQFQMTDGFGRLLAGEGVDLDSPISPQGVWVKTSDGGQAE